MLSFDGAALDEVLSWPAQCELRYISNSVLQQWGEVLHSLGETLESVLGKMPVGANSCLISTSKTCQIKDVREVDLFDNSLHVHGMTEQFRASTQTNYVLSG